MPNPLVTVLMVVSLQNACPVDHPTSRAIAERFVTMSAYATDRQQIGIAGTTPADLHLLTDSSDADMCARFATYLGGTGMTGEWQWSIYKLGAVYVVAGRHVRSDGGLHMEFLPLYVFDSNFNPLASIAM
jgi:hypothetical protein